MTPKEKARGQIDAHLAASGWVVQDSKMLDFTASRGIAVREIPLTTGPCDYLLLVDRKAVPHAEDIVHICREVFGAGNDFCKKITYQAQHPVTGKPENGHDLTKKFSNSTMPRIAVTVDMIATATNIKPLEVLIFLRDDRCRVYFEHMKGRGTRVVIPTDLQSVSGEDARAKTRFFIVDAVGVCKSDKTDSRPLEGQPTVALKTLLQRVIFPGGRDEDTLTTLAGRLGRLDRELEPAQGHQIVNASGDHTPASLANALLRAFDPDAIAERATRKPGASPEEIAPEKFTDTQQDLIAAAYAPFDKPALRQTLETPKRETEQVLDIYTPDEVLEQGYDAAAKAKAIGLVEDIRDYFAAHQAQMGALQILYSRSYRQRLTKPMLKELEGQLRDQHAALTENNPWNTFAATKTGKVKGRPQAGQFANHVALARFALEQQPVLEPFAESVTTRFHEWLMDKAKAGVSFNANQHAWLNLIRNRIATSVSIEPDDFHSAPFSQRS
jgi:type I restriction enzyme R subunit